MKVRIESRERRSGLGLKKVQILEVIMEVSLPEEDNSMLSVRRVSKLVNKFGHQNADLAAGIRDRYKVPEVPTLIISPYGWVFLSHKLAFYYTMLLDRVSTLCHIPMEALNQVSSS